MEAELIVIWEGSLHNAVKSLKDHENQLKRLEKRRERLGRFRNDAMIKLSEVENKMEMLSNAGKDAKWLEPAPVFYKKNIQRYEQEIAGIDKEIVGIRDSIHDDTDLIDLAKGNLKGC